MMKTKILHMEGSNEPIFLKETPTYYEFSWKSCQYFVELNNTDNVLFKDFICKEEDNGDTKLLFNFVYDYMKKNVSKKSVGVGQGLNTYSTRFLRNYEI